MYIFSISTLAKKENLLKDGYKQSSAACAHDDRLANGVCTEPQHASAPSEISLV